jgi:glucose-6-phosphate-specific signal transduction histidine kinase
VLVPVALAVDLEYLPSNTTWRLLNVLRLLSRAWASEASVAKVDVEVSEGNVRLSICDDGQGGADPARGSGLIGLKDRVEAQGGTITVVSPPDEGTRLHVSLPVGTAEEPVTSRRLSSRRGRFRRTLDQFEA